MAEQGTGLGLGLLSAARPWGVNGGAVPSPEAVDALLNTALEEGITYFDTAPAYDSSEGSSEERLGKWLRGLSSEDRAGLTIATKVGEVWAGGSQYQTDHSYDGMRASLDRSMKRLDGQVDVLQLHKTNPDVLRDEDLLRFWEYARELGVRTIGASVSDLTTGMFVCEGFGSPERHYGLIQLPFNQADPRFAPLIDFIVNTKPGLKVVVNRPLAMGKALQDGTRKPAEIMEAAYSFILEKNFPGFILAGTSNAVHLRQNAAAFRAAKAALA